MLKTLMVILMLSIMAFSAEMQVCIASWGDLHSMSENGMIETLANHKKNSDDPTWKSTTISLLYQQGWKLKFIERIPSNNTKPQVLLFFEKE